MADFDRFGLGIQSLVVFYKTMRYPSRGFKDAHYTPGKTEAWVMPESVFKEEYGYA